MNRDHIVQDTAEFFIPYSDTKGQSLYTVPQVTTLKLSVTSSNLNWFSKFLHWWKAYEIFYKTHTTTPISP